MFRADGPWRRRLRIGIAAVAAAFVALLGVEDNANAAHETTLEQSYASAINEVRAEHGLAPLQTEPALVDSAREHSSDMVRQGYFAHGGWLQRVLAAGAKGRSFGENLGWCAVRACPGGSPKLLIRMWLASPEHRVNVLQSRFRRLGVGIAHGSFKGNPDSVVVTTDFDG